MLLNRTRTYFVALAVAALSAASATAATEYTTQATWVAALTGGANAEALQFEYMPNQSLINPTLSAGSYGNFYGDATAVAVTNMGYFSTYSRTGDALQDTALTVTAPSGGTNASLLWLGANQIGATSVTSEPLTITLTDTNGSNTTFNLTTVGSTPSFFGFTSGTAINTITISTLSGYDVDVLDFYAGSFPNSVGGSGGGTTPTAECATLLLAAGGLIVVGVRRKFMRPVAA